MNTHRVVIEMPITGDFVLEYPSKEEADAGLTRARRKPAFVAYPMRVEKIEVQEWNG